MAAPKAKGKKFYQRLGFAMSGIKSAWKTEESFRIEVIIALVVFVIFLGLQPETMWWALLFLCTGGVLATELINTALEHIADRLHPERHPMIEVAKDCASGAVLVMGLMSLGVLAAFLWKISQPLLCLK